MLIESSVFSEFLLWIINAVAALCFIWSLKRATWQQILEVPFRQHLLIGCGFVLCGFWFMDFALSSHLIIHPLLITCVTMMLGFRFTLVVGALVSLIYLLLKDISLASTGVHFILNVVIPSGFIAFFATWVRNKNPGNLFFYTLGVGFLGGAITIPLVVLCGSLFILMADVEVVKHASALEYQWLLLAIFPEAFLNGMVVSAITVFYPEWMRTFDEEYFLTR